jgi:hypothetical protein
MPLFTPLRLMQMKLNFIINLLKIKDLVDTETRLRYYYKSGFYFKKGVRDGKSGID